MVSYRRYKRGVLLGKWRVNVKSYKGVGLRNYFYLNTYDDATTGAVVWLNEASKTDVDKIHHQRASPKSSAPPNILHNMGRAQFFWLLYLAHLGLTCNFFRRVRVKSLGDYTDATELDILTYWTLILSPEIFAVNFEISEFCSEKCTL